MVTVPVGKRDFLVFQPFTVWAVRSDVVFKLFVRNQAALFEVEQEHAP